MTQTAEGALLELVALAARQAELGRSAEEAGLDDGEDSAAAPRTWDHRKLGGLS